jgi:hypothetical protein
MYLPRRCSSIVCVVTLGVHMTLGMGWVVHIGAARSMRHTCLHSHSTLLTLARSRSTCVIFLLTCTMNPLDLFPLPSLRPPMSTIGSRSISVNGYEQATRDDEIAHSASVCRCGVVSAGVWSPWCGGMDPHMNIASHASCISARLSRSTSMSCTHVCCLCLFVDRRCQWRARRTMQSKHTPPVHRRPGWPTV